MPDPKLIAALCEAQGGGDRHAEAVAFPAVLAAMTPQRRVNQHTSGDRQSRFWAKVAWGASDCWYWCANRDDGGYGVFHDGTAKRAHRVSWEMHNGPIPPGLKVLHRCDVRNCVNPNHLFLGTQADNVADMVAKGRARSKPQHGSSNPMAALNEKQVLAIRDEFDSGRATVRQLAHEYEVAVMTIHRIVRRQSWKHL